MFFYTAAELEGYNIGFALGKLFGLVLMLAIPIIFILSLVKLFTTKRKTWLIGVGLSGLLGLGFLALVIVAMISGYNSYEENLYSEGNNQSKVIKTEDGLLELKVPKSWTALDDLAGIGSLGYGNLRKEHYILVTSEPKIDFEEGLTFDEYTELCLQNIEENCSKFEVGERTATTVADCPAEEIRISAVVDGVKIEYLSSYLETETHFHQLNLWSLPSRWGSAEPVFRSVFRSTKPLVAIERSKKKPRQPAP